MKNLNKNEKVAVFVAVFIVGFFFVFGGTVVSLFNKKVSTQSASNGLVKQDLVIGTGEEAILGKKVVVHYVGHFQDGSVFDSSIDRNEPFQFVLGTNQIISGWNEGIQGMRVGGTRVLTIPPNLGYGSQEYKGIPANSTLIFEIQLLKVE